MIAHSPSYRERITRDPAVLVGKPVVKGTRISVELILKHLAQNPDTEELLAAYPRLTIEDVQAALAYAQAVLAGDELAPTIPSHVSSPTTA
jgi:uncharacterized protein (DUF433 family)